MVLDFQFDLGNPSVWFACWLEPALLPAARKASLVVHAVNCHSLLMIHLCSMQTWHCTILLLLATNYYLCSCCCYPQCHPSSYLDIYIMVMHAFVCRKQLRTYLKPMKGLLNSCFWLAGGKPLLLTIPALSPPPATLKLLPGLCVW